MLYVHTRTSSTVRGVQLSGAAGARPAPSTLSPDKSVEAMPAIITAVHSLEGEGAQPSDVIARVRELLPLSDRADILQCAPVLLRLHGHSDQDIRKLVLVAAEELVKYAPEALPQLLEPVLACMSDDNPQVVRRALLTATAILRPALAMVAVRAAVKGEDISAAALGSFELMWQRLCEIKKRLLEMLAPPSAGAIGAQVAANPEWWLTTPGHMTSWARLRCRPLTVRILCVIPGAVGCHQARKLYGACFHARSVGRQGVGLHLEQRGAGAGPPAPQEASSRASAGSCYEGGS